MALLAVVTLRQAGAGVDALITGRALLSLHTWTTVLGQGFLPAVNALLLGSLIYKSRLVPRILPVLGFIGAPLLVASVAGTLFGSGERCPYCPGSAHSCLRSGNFRRAFGWSPKGSGAVPSR